MSWLARISVDPALSMERRLLSADGYAWHQAAWRAFPSLEGQVRPFLSRLDSAPEGFTLLLLSKAHRPERPDWCPDACWAVKLIAPGFLSHKHYRFDLRANPSRKVTKFGADGERTKNGRRQPLTKIAEQTAWLSRKAGLYHCRSAGSRVLPRPGIPKKKMGAVSILECVFAVS